jgi:hypothetical protein
MNNTHRKYLDWRLLLLFGIALAFISCGTSTVGNPGSSAVVSFGIKGQDTSGALFTYSYDSAANRWDVTIEPSTLHTAPEKPWGGALVIEGDTNVYATGGSIKVQ